MPNRTSYFEALNNEVLRTISSTPQTSFHDADADSSFTNECRWLLPGEDIKIEEDGVGYSSLFGKIFGKVYVTNYRLRFVDDNRSKNNHSFDLTLGSISKVDKIGFSNVSRGEDSYGIEILCKDMRNIRFVHRPETHSRRPLYDCLQKYAFPNTNKLPFFATLYRQTFNRDGWSLFNTEREFKRQKMPKNLWSITRINANYEMASTYPAILAVPTEAVSRKNGEEFLRNVANFRSKQRIPVLSWIDWRTCVAVIRSAQPLVGVTLRKSAQDEEYLDYIIAANPNSAQLIILDARPSVNAKANRAKGGGYETSYARCELTFLDIQNIHVVRDSLRRLKDACFPRIDHKRFNRTLEETKWLVHLQTILDGANRVVMEVTKNRNSVLVHCSDGWDRTAQLTALAMLQLDAYYRTIEGFGVLVEKEWCSFGHKFAHRIGHGEDKHNDGERSPIFVQFIDCVWQLYNQFISSFEFNVKFLKTILDELYACRFGTFLYNSEKERQDLQVKKNTVSLWSYILENRQQFENPLYDSRHTGVQDFLSAVDGTLYTKFWADYYCRYNPEVILPERDVDDPGEEYSIDDASDRQSNTTIMEKRTVFDEDDRNTDDRNTKANRYDYHLNSDERYNNGKNFNGIDRSEEPSTPVRERIRLKRDEFLAELQQRQDLRDSPILHSARDVWRSHVESRHHAESRVSNGDMPAYYVTVVEQQPSAQHSAAWCDPDETMADALINAEVDGVIRIPRAKFHSNDASSSYGSGKNGKRCGQRSFEEEMTITKI